jgi:cytochrome c556
MRRFLTFAAAIAVFSVAAVSAQKPDPAMLDAAMKKVAANNGAIGKAAKSGDFATAKASATAVKAALQEAHAFWVAAKKEDAIKMSNDAIAALTATETAAGAAGATAESVFAAVKQQGATCGACHKAYRDQTADTPPVFSLKPGTI